MLPNQRFIMPRPLFSGRGGTFYTPETLLLSMGIGQAEHARDESVNTYVHEGIHWRQFHGTTFGAFYHWLKHSQECDTVQKLVELPASQREELLARRLGPNGRPILSLDDDNLPSPPLTSESIRRDPVDLMRMIWFDHQFVLRFFLAATDVGRHPDPLEDILASVSADAATALAHLHPEWEAYAYDDVREHYRVTDRIGRAGYSGEELTTNDILEGAAAANELMLSAYSEEVIYRAPDSAPLSSLLVLGDEPDENFPARARHTLESAYGRAARAFFSIGAVDYIFPREWIKFLAACDVALNPPLPPLVRPGNAPPLWRDLYPPLRFLALCKASKKVALHGVGTVGDIVGYQCDLSDAAQTSTPTLEGIPILSASRVDYGVIAERSAVRLWNEGITYYDFLMWCRKQTWDHRAQDVRLVVAPALFLRDNVDIRLFLKMQTSMAMKAPVINTDGRLDHSYGSTIEFGSWFALSSLVHYLLFDLVVGVGDPHLDPYPAELVEHGPALKKVMNALRGALQCDPWPTAS